MQGLPQPVAHGGAMKTEMKFSGVAVLGILAGCDGWSILVEPAVYRQGASAIAEWSPPVGLGEVNSPHTDVAPALSADGLTLYFSSDRPGGAGGFDLWMARRTSVSGPWGAAVNLGPEVNSSADETAPNLSADGGLLLLTSNRAGGLGGNDIWAARRSDPRDHLGWQQPLNIGAGVNGPGSDAGPHLRVGELYVESHRAGGPPDIFVADVDLAGEVGSAVLVAELSSGSHDGGPGPRSDGLEMAFHSNRTASVNGSFDLWMAARNDRAEEWTTPLNLGRGINTAFAEIEPFLSSDGQTLLFASDRPGGAGGLDLYVTTRVAGSGPEDPPADPDPDPEH